METLKLFLAGSFAAAAGLRLAVPFASELILGNGSAAALFLGGPSGMAVEALLSLVFGAVVAGRIVSAKPQKASRA